MLSQPDIHALLSRARDLIHDAEAQRICSGLLAHDIRQAASGRKVHFVVDFSEIHRYVNPTLEGMLTRNPETYHSDQLAVRYLFERVSRDAPLVLIPPYFRELKEFVQMTRARMGQLKELVERPGTTSDRLQALREHPAMGRLLRQLASAREAAKGTRVAEAVRTSMNTLVSMLYEPVRRECLGRGLQSVVGMMMDGRIVGPHAVGIGDLPTEAKGRVYNHFLDILQQMRPFVLQNNVNDAEAAASVVDLNERNASGGHYFAIATGSPTLIRTVRALEHADPPMTYLLFDQFPELDLTRNSRSAGSVVRELSYFLLKLYYRSTSNEEVLVGLEHVQHLICEYRLSTEDLLSWIAARNLPTLSQGELDRIESLTRYLEEQLVVLGGVLRAPLSEHLVPELTQCLTAAGDLDTVSEYIEALDGIMQEPERLRETLDVILSELDEALTMIEDAAARIGIRTDTSQATPSGGS